MKTAPQAFLDRVDAQRAQTHCIHGHEYTQENTIYCKPRGTRQCKTCHRVYNQAWHQKQRDARADQIKAKDGIIDEIALMRAVRGDERVYENLTRAEHRALVHSLLDADELPPFQRLRDAVSTARGRRARRALVHRNER